jgi:hypothetical protein
MVQLTSDTQLPDAIRFHASLGFVALHERMKLRSEPVSAPGSGAGAAP